MPKPAVILVGGDKGGVGKTTVARTLIDYFGTNQTPIRAFDTEFAARHAQTFPSLRDQSRGRDLGLRSNEDFRHAGQCRRQGDGDRRARWAAIAYAAGAERHRLPRVGQERPDCLRCVPYPRSLDHFTRGNCRDRPLRRRRQPFPGQEPHQRDPVFEWDPATYKSYFKQHQGRPGDHHSKAQRDGLRAGGSGRRTLCLVRTNKNAKGEVVDNSFVLRGYVRHWLGQVWGEFDRVKLLDLVSPKLERNLRQVAG